MNQAITATSKVKAVLAPFPATQKHEEGIVNEVHTDVASVYFSDKILITICQDGRLAHWVHVPLESTDPSQTEQRLLSDDPDSQLLPMPRLTASTILGASGTDRDTLGHLFATQIGSALVAQNPEENRLLVVGMAFSKPELDRDSFLQILELVLRCIEPESSCSGPRW